MRVNFVLNPNNANWILEKFAIRMSEQLQFLGHEAEIHEAPVLTAEVNHFLSYNFVTEPPIKSTIFVTHIDDKSKLKHLRKLSIHPNVASLICLSGFTKEFLVSENFPSHKLAFITPAVDKMPELRRLRIGLSSYIYKDGRKKEQWIQMLARSLPLSRFEFYIFGSGWEQTVLSLEQSGAKVNYMKASHDFLGDHKAIIDTLQCIDYWMYLGFDEGSMGCLDASLAGVPLITTPQGFHLDLPGGIMHEISNFEDLFEVFSGLALKPGNIDFQEKFSWKRYTSDALRIWEGESNFESTLDLNSSSFRVPLYEKNSPLVDMTFRRYVSAIGRLPFAQTLRKFIRRERKL